MNSYNLETVIQELDDFRKKLGDNQEENLDLAEELKNRYPYTSSSDSLVELMMNELLETRIIAKLMISECNKDALPQSMQNDIMRILEM